MNRRDTILALLALGIAPQTTKAQQFPSRPIKLVVPFAPGGSTDLVARILAERVAQDLGQPIIVENRAGAGGHLGTEVVSRAPPDGATIVLNGTGPMAISLAGGLKLSYDPLKDLAPIAVVTSLPNLITVNASLPIKSVEELIAYAKANPGKLNYGISAVGNLSHLNAEMFAQVAGITLVGVPYKGSGPLITDLVAGTIQLSFDNLPPYVPHVKSGKLRALAVTSAKRSSLLPETRSLAELGYSGFDNSAWFAIFGPARLSPDVVARLSEEFQKAVQMPDIVQRLQQQGVEPAPGGPEALSARLRNDIETFSRVIRQAGIKLE